jgi:hypothetical protein
MAGEGGKTKRGGKVLIFYWARIQKNTEYRTPNTEFRSVALCLALQAPKASASAPFISTFGVRCSAVRYF